MAVKKKVVRKLKIGDAFRFLAKEFGKIAKYDHYWGEWTWSFHTDWSRYGICSGIDALCEAGKITRQIQSDMIDLLNREFKERKDAEGYLLDSDYFWPLPDGGKIDPVRQAACLYLAVLSESKLQY